MTEANKLGITTLGPIVAVMICAAAMVGVAVMHEPSSAQVAADAEGVPIGERLGQSLLTMDPVVQEREFILGVAEYDSVPRDVARENVQDRADFGSIPGQEIWGLAIRQFGKL